MKLYISKTQADAFLIFGITQEWLDEHTIVVDVETELEKFIHQVEASAAVCVCGHLLDHHSQLSGGCYAFGITGCDCGGYREEAADGVDAASEGRDPSTRER